VAKSGEPSVLAAGLPACFDPYLRYAIATGFNNFESFSEEEFRLFFLVEFKRPQSAKAFERKMGAAKFDVELGPAHDHSRYATLRTGTAAVLDHRAYPIWTEFVSRVELSLPLKLATVLRPPRFRRALVHRWDEGKDPPGSLLIGVLDDGCPFAAAQFLRSPTSAGASTRVRGVWDQNQGKQPVNVVVSATASRPFGHVPLDFGYGVEFSRDFKTAGGLEIGLDEWIGRHLTPAGSIDEDGCYADGGFTRLASRQSHGAHVMDVFAGRLPTSSRVGPSRPGQDRRDPPSWKAGTDPACKADVDVVFVQFSDRCIRDATGVWLKAYVFDGLQYILSFAHPTKTKKVVVNLSYGPTTGPHDGTAELETALTAFVTEFNGTPGKPKLEIALAAGNAYLSQGHIAFTNNTSQTADVQWTWRLPPDNAVLCFAEVWIDNANAGGVTVTLTSPSGVVAPTGLTPPPTGSLPSSTGVYHPVVWGSHTMWLLAVEATIAGSGAVAEHGDWTIKVSGIPQGAEVHAYVARSDPNMGVRTGAKRSHFVDPDWEVNHSAAAGCTYVDGEFDNTGSLVHRYGTLNGIATASDASVHVAGGYILANGRKSPYASAGPARRGPLTPRRLGPDYALPCDESYALEGIRAGGNRTGVVFRLTGTSAAAPQLARRVANPPLPAPNNVPNSPEQRGAGNLEPP
jgi:hypothetical protein